MSTPGRPTRAEAVWYRLSAGCLHAITRQATKQTWLVVQRERSTDCSCAASPAPTTTTTSACRAHFFPGPPSSARAPFANDGAHATTPGRWAVARDGERRAPTKHGPRQVPCPMQNGARHRYGRGPLVPAAVSGSAAIPRPQHMARMSTSCANRPPPTPRNHVSVSDGRAVAPAGQTLSTPGPAACKGYAPGWRRLYEDELYLTSTSRCVDPTTPQPHEVHREKAPDNGPPSRPLQL